MTWGRNSEGQPLIAFGGDGKIVKVYNVITGKETAQLIGNKHTISSIKFKPDEGNLLLTASYDYTVRLWDI